MVVSAAAEDAEIAAELETVGAEMEEASEAEAEIDGTDSDEGGIVMDLDTAEDTDADVETVDTEIDMDGAALEADDGAIVETLLDTEIEGMVEVEILGATLGTVETDIETDTDETANAEVATLEGIPAECESELTAEEDGGAETALEARRSAHNAAKRGEKACILLLLLDQTSLLAAFQKQE